MEDALTLIYSEGDNRELAQNANNRFKRANLLHGQNPELVTSTRTVAYRGIEEAAQPEQLAHKLHET